jgi:glutamate decarboxylase
MAGQCAVVVKKFARYFDVEPRAVPIHDTTHYMMEAKEAVSYVDENTICVFSILGSTFTGHFEKVKLLSRELDVLAKEKGYTHDTHNTQHTQLTGVVQN